MYTSNQHSKLIQRLKLQPRHSRVTTISDALGALNTSAKVLGSSVVSATDSINKLNDQTRKASGYQYLSSILDNLGTKYQTVVKEALDFEKRNKSLQDSFGLTAESAAKLGASLDKVAHQYAISEDNIRKYAGAIKNLLPTLRQSASSDKSFYQGMIKTQKILQTNLGLTEDQANKYTLYAQSVGKTGDEMLRATKNIADSIDPAGDVGAFKMITEEIASASEELTLQYGKIPGQLEAAVIKAKKFGLSLEQVKTTADGLLDIESSIGSELEYQLLSGRRLVDEVTGKSLTNTIREAALRGDMATQAEAMNQLIEQEGETLESNLFARKQMSQLLGMDEQQLASAIQKKKILDKSAAKGLTIDLEGSDAIAQAAAALKAGAITPEDFKTFSDQVDTRSTEDLLKESIEIQKAQLFYATLQDQADITKMSKEALLKFSVGKYEVSADQTREAGAARILYNQAMATFDATLELFNKVKEPIDKLNPFANDMVSFPGYGKRTLFAKEGAIQLNDNDMVVAGTKLFGGTSDTATFAKAVVDAINNQTKQLLNQTYSGINTPYYG